VGEQGVGSLVEGVAVVKDVDEAIAIPRPTRIGRTIFSMSFSCAYALGFSILRFGGTGK